MLSVAAIGLRAFTLLFGVVVLGLSVTLAKHQVIGNPPSETSFGSFTGAFGVVVSIIGLVSLWVDKVPAIFVIAADALSSIFYLAGGIAMVLALKGIGACTDSSLVSLKARFDNKILNGGCVESYCYVGGSGIDNNGADHTELTPRCQRAQADYVIEFIAFIFGLAIIALGWVLHRRGGTSARSYV